MPSKTVTCPHRWRIEEPNGPTSAALCLACGSRRDMPNSHFTDWNPSFGGDIQLPNSRPTRRGRKVRL